MWELAHHTCCYWIQALWLYPRYLCDWIRGISLIVSAVSLWLYPRCICDCIRGISVIVSACLWLYLRYLCDCIHGISVIVSAVYLTSWRGDLAEQGLPVKKLIKGKLCMGAVMDNWEGISSTILHFWKYIYSTLHHISFWYKAVFTILFTNNHFDDVKGKEEAKIWYVCLPFRCRMIYLVHSFLTQNFSLTEQRI